MTTTILPFIILIIIAASFCLVFDTSKGVVFVSMKEKNETAYLLIVVALMIVIMGGNSWNPDTVGYQRIYNDPSSSTDYGFVLIMMLCRTIGLDMNALRLIIAVIGILLINAVVRKHLAPKYQLLFYAAYAIVPFSLDVVQIRNFLAMAVFIYAIEMYTEDTTISGKVKYLLLLIIAVSIHKAFILYAPLVLLEYVRTHQTVKKLLVIMASATVAFLWCKPVMNVLKHILQRVLLGRFAGAAYYLSQSTNLGAYAYEVLLLIYLGCISYCVWLLKDSGIDIESNIFRFCSYTCLINFYGILFWPLFHITMDFFRIQRNFLVFNHIVFFATLSEERKTRYTGLPDMALVILGIVGLSYSFFWLFVKDGGIVTIIEPILTNNWILGIGKQI